MLYYGFTRLVCVYCNDFLAPHSARLARARRFRASSARRRCLRRDRAEDWRVSERAERSPVQSSWLSRVSTCSSSASSHNAAPTALQPPRPSPLLCDLRSSQSFACAVSRSAALTCRGSAQAEPKARSGFLVRQKGEGAASSADVRWVRHRRLAEREALCRASSRVVQR